MGRGDSRNEPVGKATAAVASAQWEVEEDHLLSYFLGGDGTTDNADNGDNAVELSSERNGESPVDHTFLRHGTVSAPTLEQQSSDLSFDSKSPSPSPESNGIIKRSSSLGRSSQLSVKFLDNIPEEPSALHDPSATHGRVGSNGSMCKVSSATSSSSSSSLSNMAAALALGGPNQVAYIQQKLRSREVPASAAAQHGGSAASPLTPVNMFGSPAGQETMMLPPPPRFPVADGNDGVAHSRSGYGGVGAPRPHYFQQPQQLASPSMQMPTRWNQQQGHSPNTQQHLTWIQQMNAACFAAQQQQQQAAGPAQLQQCIFTDPSPVPSAVASQPQNAPFRQPPVQGQHQIQVGVDGATIPVTAVANADGTVSYRIDPNAAAVPPSRLRFLTNAINEAAKPAEPNKEDPAAIAEKRQRRLARNRESARQSRRRKKDHLNNLGEKVKRLQRQMEVEVASQIKSMETGMTQTKSTTLNNFLDGPEADTERLRSLLQGTSANCSIRRAVVSHQYNCLRQAFLSTHNHCSVWLMMKDSQFFVEGCRQTPRPAESKGIKSAASRPNSKQVGEEIVANEKSGESALTANADDAPRMWPLLCHELTMTMDQEERIINQAHEQAKSTTNLHTKLQHIEKATSATHTLRNAMLCLSQCSSELNENILLDILTPRQTALFLEWSIKNKERCRGAMERRSQCFGTVPGHGLDHVRSELESIKLVNET